MAKRALLTGISGQDGSYLAELLLKLGYQVHGIIRRSSTFNTYRLDQIYEDPHSPNVRLRLYYGDLANGEQLTSLIYNVQPDEIYHLGAQSHVKVSFEIPEYTGDITGLGVVRVLEAIRRSGVRSRFYQASSSEIFGAAPPPQNEQTVFQPRSPYGIAKAYAHWMTVNYREAYQLFACNGILFNHESPRRGETFVSRKITRAVARIVAGRREKLYLGNLNSRRDWGYAPEYVEGMWRILQQERCEDYVLGTGESHSVQEFVEEAFGYAGLDYREHVEIDANYIRPTEVDSLLADITKARIKLNWEPRVTFRGLVRLMVDADLEAEGMPPVGERKSVLAGRPRAWNHSLDHFERIEDRVSGRSQVETRGDV